MVMRGKFVFDFSTTTWLGRYPHTYHLRPDASRQNVVYLLSRIAFLQTVVIVPTELDQ